jgi:MtaA/CmuA family methyltransferase
MTTHREKEDLDQRTRLLRALGRLPVDRPPVVCTGGSMTAVPAEVVARSSFSLPAAHLDPQAMAGLALQAAHITGFENVGVPLCVTVEAEALGVTIDLGDAYTEARAAREPFTSVTQVVLPATVQLLETGRVPVVVQAVRILKSTAGSLPICANLIGPASLAASLVEPTALLKEQRSRPVEVHALVERITDFLLAWIRQLVDAGADVIVIHEDTLTPSLVGPKFFAQGVAPHLERLAVAICATGARSVLHMCGALGGVVQTLENIGFDAYVPDTAIPLDELARELPHTALVGNVSTFLLHRGSAEALAQLSRRLAASGCVHAVSPACGMSSATPLGNITALTENVKMNYQNSEVI